MKQAIFIFLVLSLTACALANQGRGDTCAAIAGMNAHEARAKIAEAQNASLATVTGNVIKGATAITGIIVGGDVIKSGIKNSGTNTNVNGNENIMGPDQSTTTHQSYSMTEMRE